MSVPPRIDPAHATSGEGAGGPDAQRPGAPTVVGGASRTGEDPDGRRPRVVLGLVLVGVGGLWAASSLGLPMRWDIVLAAALVAVGVLVLSLRRRTTAGAFVWVGVVLALLATFLPASSDGTVAGGAIGERELQLSDPAELEDRYVTGVGSLTLDLRDLDPIEDVTEIAGRVAIGELVVLVPPDVEIQGEGGVVLGEVSAWGRDEGGIVPRLTLTDPARGGGPVLALDLWVGLGRIEVTR